MHGYILCNCSSFKRWFEINLGIFLTRNRTGSGFIKFGGSGYNQTGSTSLVIMNVYFLGLESTLNFQGEAPVHLFHKKGRIRIRIIKMWIRNPDIYKSWDLSSLPTLKCFYKILNSGGNQNIENLQLLHTAKRGCKLLSAKT